MRRFVSRIYKITEKQFGRDFGLRDQLRRAAVSILLNISEGFERASNIDFARFINQAKASAGECRAVFYIAFDNRYLEEEQFNELKSDSLNISRQLAKFGIFSISSHKK